MDPIMKKLLSSLLTVLLIAALLVPAYADRIPHGMAENNSPVPGGIGDAKEKLAEGLNEERDPNEAEGLSISEKMRGQLRGLDEASTSIQDGTELIREAEQTGDKTEDLLREMRDLALRDQQDGLPEEEKEAIRDRLREIEEEILEFRHGRGEEPIDLIAITL